MAIMAVVRKSLKQPTTVFCRLGASAASVAGGALFLAWAGAWALALAWALAAFAVAGRFRIASGPQAGIYGIPPCELIHK